MSRRDRARVTREDATGFTDNSKAVAIMEEMKMNAGLKAAKEVAEAQREAEDAARAAGPKSNASGVQSPKEKPAELDSKTLDPEHDAHTAVNDNLPELVIPPGRGNSFPFTLRLDVLERQGRELRALEAQGVPWQSVLRSAANRLSRRVVEKYVPQVGEPRARGMKWRIEVRLPAGYFDRVEKMVRGGAEAPRKALLVGQFEPEWFAAVDDVIERMKR